MSRDELETEYLQARDKVNSLTRKISREERVIEHFGANQSLDIQKMWDKLIKETARRDDLLHQLQELPAAA